MFRFNFVPMEAQNGALVIAVADPSQVLLSDELPLLLGKKLILKVATPTQISDLLKRTEQSQRVLDQATEAFTLTVVEEDEEIRFEHLRRQPDAAGFGGQPGGSPGGHGDFHGARTARLRHPYRGPRHRGRRQVPH